MVPATRKAHFRVVLSFCIKARLVHNHSYENEFNLHVNEISFSYEKMGTKTRFEEEAKDNSEMAYFDAKYEYTLGDWSAKQVPSTSSLVCADLKS